jgi:hypothetical protein
VTSIFTDILRQRLIRHFQAQQAAANDYLSFHEVAQKWAYLRTSGTISEEKERAIGDLMEAAFDGLFPQLFWMNRIASVELLPCFKRETVEEIAGEIRRKGCEGDPWVESENTALMSPEKFAYMRTELGLKEVNDCYLREKFKDYLWGPRDEVVKFLEGRGVNIPLLPPSWRSHTCQQDDLSGSADTEKRPKSDMTQVEEAYLLRVKESRDQGKQPSRADDEKWFRDKFCIKRDEARCIRKKLAPAEWQDPGRPGE